MENKKLIYEEIKERLRDQINVVDQITTKFNIVLGFNSVILAFLIQAFINNIKLGYLMKISVGLLLVSILIDFRGLVIQKYRRDPDPWGLYDNYYNKDLEKTMVVLIQNFTDSINENVKKLHRLNKYYAISISITLLALILIIIEFMKGDVSNIWEKIMISLRT